MRKELARRYFIAPLNTNSTGNPKDRKFEKRICQFPRHCRKFICDLPEITIVKNAKWQNYVANRLLQLFLWLVVRFARLVS